jgi:putative transposase
MGAIGILVHLLPKTELIDRRPFRSHSEARMAVFQFIEGFYNPARRHSALGYLSPTEYERKHHGLSKPA